MNERQIYFIKNEFRYRSKIIWKKYNKKKKKYNKKEQKYKQFLSIN